MSKAIGLNRPYAAHRVPPGGIALNVAKNILLDCRTSDFQNVPFSRVVSDSRRVGPGDVFVCVRGTKIDGHQFADRAVTAGAAAIVTEQPLSLPRAVPQLIVDNARRALAMLSQAVRGRPSEKMKVIGVTGTNGKTTTAYLIRSILECHGAKTGMIGTIACETGESSQASDMTTPDPVKLARLLAEMVAAGETHAVMEVSSHGLHQHRTDGIAFAAAAFTNLTPEHLDYHLTMPNYRDAKARLFESLPSGAAAIVNADDKYGSHMLEISTAGRNLRYGLDSKAEITADILAESAAGSRFTLRTPAGSVDVHTALVGRHNVSNCLAAAGVCLSVGVPLAGIAEGLAQRKVVPGRLQPIDAGGDFTAMVDYAHTDDALEKVLESVRLLSSGKRVLLVFGCGGDRDREKRPRMAAVAERRADLMFVTSDNPRTESPERIIEEVCAGFSPEGRRRVVVEHDRACAIRAALDAAAPGDVVLVAGKGHEDYQDLGSRRIHFDDREVIAEWAGRRGVSG